MFDKERAGTGTREWAEITFNCCRGCSNNCLYCYAAHNADRFKQKLREDWQNEEFTKNADIKSYPARDGIIMFPSSHDITPFNVDQYIRIAKLMLEKGNHLLIVSKPRMECIAKVMVGLERWKSQILFRFTIGTIVESKSLFWEPGAPLPEERLDCLEIAFKDGFATSVSSEPMLAGRYGATEVVNTVFPMVTESIWIGKMNKALLRVDKVFKPYVDEIMNLQSDSEILLMHDDLKDNPKIRWKDSIKMVINKEKT